MTNDPDFESIRPETPVTHFYDISGKASGDSGDLPYIYLH